MIRGRYLTSRDDRAEVFAVRNQVFVCEQGFSAEIEVDAHDDMAVYALAYLEDGAPVATGRLYIDADRFYIGRVCALSRVRGQGFGDFIMRMLLARAMDLGAPAVHITAQLPVIDFYERYGFEFEDDELHYEEGVPHRRMLVKTENIRMSGLCGGGDCENCEKNCGDARAELDC